MRYVAIVTDAELAPERGAKSVELGCAGCSGSCFSACKTAAFQPEVHEIVLGGVPQRFRKFDVNRCNWAKRYSLVGSEGNQYTGWHLDLAYPEQLNEETLADALRQLPHIEKNPALQLRTVCARLSACQKAITWKAETGKPEAAAIPLRFSATVTAGTVRR